jgi:hypothetical protein
VSVTSLSQIASKVIFRMLTKTIHLDSTAYLQKNLKSCCIIETIYISEKWSEAKTSRFVISFTIFKEFVSLKQCWYARIHCCKDTLPLFFIICIGFPLSCKYCKIQNSGAVLNFSFTFPSIVLVGDWFCLGAFFFWL